MKKILVILFWICTSLAFSQAKRSFGHRVDFKHYSNEQGFFSPNIRNLFEDSKGRLWVCCQDGLWVFDGRTFYNFSTKDGFMDCDVGSICEDNNGAMWIGTNEGIFVYKNKKFTRLDTAGGKMPRWISWSMFKDHDGTIWAGTKIGLYHLDPSDLSKPLIRKYMMPDAAGRNVIRLVKRKKDGTLILGSESAYWAQKKDSFVLEAPLSWPLYSLIEFDNGKEWFSGWGAAVMQFKDHKPDSSFDLGSGVLSLAKDRLGNVWLSTFEKGLFKYDGKEIVNYSGPEGLNYNAFWTSMTDREGNVWFGSFGNGLYKYSGDGITSINSKNGLFNEVVTNMSQDTAGKVWVVTENSLACYDPKLNSVTNYTSYNGKPVSAITNLGITSNNEVLALGYSGNGFKFHKGKLTSEPWIGGFAACLGDTNEFYIISERGLHRRSPNGTITPVETKRPVSRAALNLFKDKKGRIWVMNVFFGAGFYNGVNYYKFNEKNGFVKEPATSVYGGEKDTFWLGTRGRGVYKCVLVKDTVLKIIDSITSANGLYSDIVTSVDIHNNKMYLGTAYGLGVMDMQDYAKGSKRIKMYTAEEGLVNTICTVCFIDKHGKLWMATPKGAFIFDTKLQSFNGHEPNIQITNIQLHYENIDWQKMGFVLDRNDLPMALELPYDQNHFTFQFIGVSHTAPSKVKYQCMIMGLDQEWSPVSNKNEITFSNIPPGTYTFMVRSCNNDGVWNKEPATFAFSITPPFWRTSWFRGLVAIVIILCILLTIRFREKKLRKEKLVLEERVNERTGELKEALEQLGEKQKEIIDSINYAQRLQKAMLASEKVIKTAFPESFVLFKPKDIVSGDFYWMVQLEDKAISKNIFVFAAADCTGHGVPGAFMSMLNSTLLNQTVHNPSIRTPADVLNFMNEELPKNLRSDETDNINDGMDIAFCLIDLKTNILKYSGANNPCWIVRDNELLELKPVKQAITASVEYDKKIFVDQEMSLLKGDSVYIFTDGYADQFGGPKGKKFKYKTLADLLISINKEPLQKQKQILDKAFYDWKGNLDQVDDICIIGIRI
jgi:ligand-binding sensor domain-containing protein/serine phosphatase RsbU (regulator of sigma subunit)